MTYEGQRFNNAGIGRFLDPSQINIGGVDGHYIYEPGGKDAFFRPNSAIDLYGTGDIKHFESSVSSYTPSENIWQKWDNFNNSLFAKVARPDYIAASQFIYGTLNSFSTVYSQFSNKSQLFLVGDNVENLRGQKLNATFGNENAENLADIALFDVIITSTPLKGFGKGVTSLEKASGSYLLEFQSGKFYAGKGLESRMMKSINRIETTFGDKLLNKTFYPAANSKAAFINEHNIMMQMGGPIEVNEAKNTYNLIFSPGKKLGGF